MTRTMLAAMGAALVVAGVASAHVFSSTSERSTRVTAVQPQSSQTPPPVIAKTSAPVAVTKIAATTQPELQRSPVPLRHAPRPPVPIREDIVGKPGDDKIDRPVDSATATAPTPEDEEGARLAKSAIERDGYKNVKMVSKAADGSWRGRARRGQTEVGVTVDAAGNVRAD